MPPRSRRWSRVALVAAAIGYPIALGVVVILIRFVGESWWVTGLGMYLPRIGFAAPLPLLLMAIAIARRPKLLWFQLCAMLLLVFPLMGLELAWPWAHTANAQPKLRVLSYNVNSGYGDFRAIVAEISQFEPDIVLVQELFTSSEPLQGALRKRYPHIQVSTQFLIASRLPIRSSNNPERVDFYGAKRSPRFMRYVVDTAIGPITIFSMHTVSPRGGIHALRGDGLRREILSGRAFRGEKAGQLQTTASLRSLQVQAVAKLAAQESGPVLIAGDTNLPALSPVFARFLGEYQDGFSELGIGFGYTYPSKLPWLRIDRILANDQLRFIAFETGSSRASDHFCVVADLVAAAP